MKNLAKSPAKPKAAFNPPPKLVPPPGPATGPATRPQASERFRCSCAHCEPWRRSYSLVHLALVDAFALLETTYKINAIRWTEKEHARVREIRAMVGR